VTDKGEFIESIVQRMSLRQKIGQCVVVGMSGTTLTNDIREAITRYECGGIRLSPYYRNFQYFSAERAVRQELGPDFRPSLQKTHKQGFPPHRTPEEYAALLNELRALAAARSPAVPLHMVIDQEGDTSRDLARGGVAQFPSSLGLAASGSPELTYRVAKSVALQLRASGVNMIHSPVVDVNINPENPEIGKRAFGDEPELVAEHGSAMMHGLREGGVIPCAKHFPGRGDSAADAHFSCPVLEVDEERFQRVELAPYRRLIAEGLETIMLAHGIYRHRDPDRISTVSPAIVTDLLRGELGFRGVITTDSMTMGALIDRYGIGEACARALAAGADIVLMKAENQWRGEVFHTLERWAQEGLLPEEELDAKLRRILELKYRYGLFERQGMVDASEAARPYTDAYVRSTAEIAAKRAMITFKDELEVLPLPTGRRILLVNQALTLKTPNDVHDHPALFQELLEAELPEIQTVETSFGFDEADEERVLEWASAVGPELIVCTNWYDRAAEPASNARALIEAGYRVLLVTNTPYTIQGRGGLLAAAPSVLLVMNLTPDGLRAAVGVLMGRIGPEGTWPLKHYRPEGWAPIRSAP
jgi:beta-N-acetylhexosaminidase